MSDSTSEDIAHQSAHADALKRREGERQFGRIEKGVQPGSDAAKALESFQAAADAGHGLSHTETVRLERSIADATHQSAQQVHDGLREYKAQIEARHVPPAPGPPPRPAAPEVKTEAITIAPQRAPVPNTQPKTTAIPRAIQGTGGTVTAYLMLSGVITSYDLTGTPTP